MTTKGTHIPFFLFASGIPGMAGARGGMRSLLGFWMGGADSSSGAAQHKAPAWRRIAAQRTLSQRRKDEEEAILLLLS